MSEKVTGGPAFPSLEKVEQYDDERGGYVSHWLPTGGMDLRDYFAAQALPQAIEHERALREAMGIPGNFRYEAIAIAAYAVADAMLKAREAK